MGTSADQEDRDDKKDAATEGHDTEGHDEEADTREAEPASKSSSAAGTSDAGVKGVRGPGAGRAPKAPKGGSLGKSIILFAVIVGGLAVGFAVLGREGSQNEPPARPKWAVGQAVDVEVTVVNSDRQDLSCASDTEIAGKRCAFDSAQKPRAAGDDKSTLKPYTTTEATGRAQFVGAGLWSSLGGAPLPPQRFSVKCTYTVEGTLRKLDVRWSPNAQWYSNADWYSGALSGCKIVP